MREKGDREKKEKREENNSKEYYQDWKNDEDKGRISS